MMSRQSKEKTVSGIFSKIPFSLLGKLTQTNLIIPYYHIVSDDEILHVKHLYAYKTIRQFKEDMDFLLINYSPIGLLDVLNFIKTGRPLSEKAFLLTFDDGFREMNDIVAPILLERGICATFFVNSAFIENKQLCYLNKASLLAEEFLRKRSLGLEEKLSVMLNANEIEFNDIKSGILSIRYQQRHLLDEIAQVMNMDFTNYLLMNRPYLTSNQINKLIAKGFTIGAHSIDHSFYPALSLKDQLHQAVESVKEIREKFCLNYGAFAFPHSDSGVSGKFFKEFYNSGLVDISFGTGGMLDDSLRNHLQRFSLESPLMPAKNLIAIQYARKIYKSVTLHNPIVHG